MKTNALVLFVDDEVEITTLLKLSFRKEIKEGAFDFAFASSAVEGLEILRSNFDNNKVLFLVTDINMPAQSGFYLADAVKKRYQNVYVYLCSAYDRPDYVDKGKELGVEHFFKKPIKMDDMKKVLKSKLQEVLSHLQLG